MEADEGPRVSDEILFSYQPEASFTRTIGWLFAIVPLIGVLAGIIDLFSGRAVSVGLVTIAVSIAVAGLVYLGSRSIDRVQQRIRVQVLASGVMRFRNFVGRVREIPLRKARSFEIKDLRGKPRIAGGGAGSRLRNPFSSELELKGRSGDRRSPHFTEIRVKDEQGKRHVVTLSGAMPVKEARRLKEAVNAVRKG